ncbi:MAG: type II restriction endonuclease [Thermoflexales bacterium]|nr:type II restriction endonuclease [Thermoflexales bacterium]MCS7324899.1 type II restriction endonuclease [Thermoflexales bacterium]MCX7939358.1 type II restriction endonuclease [Thermoflexales bacterium]MDW8053664.1 type II restriction endonuclease [Anaerolineae bacterium]MDW8293499.1 type II restriction endonuclease [Anaerolineae bacterium]
MSDDALIQEAKRTIPSLEQMRVELERDSEKIKGAFEDKLVALDQRGAALFAQYQEKALRRLVELWLDAKEQTLGKAYLEVLQEQGWQAFKQTVLPTLVELSRLVQRLEKDLGNMRKARGGSWFQYSIQLLLQQEGIASEFPLGANAKALGRVDMVVPSVKVAREQPDKAFFITCKRTLRERWKQEVPQGVANRRYYLVTLDSALSASKAEEIKMMNLIAYVPTSVCDALQQQCDMPWIRPLNQLPRDLR